MPTTHTGQFGRDQSLSLRSELKSVYGKTRCVRWPASPPCWTARSATSSAGRLTKPSPPLSPCPPSRPWSAAVPDTPRTKKLRTILTTLDKAATQAQDQALAAEDRLTALEDREARRASRTADPR